MKKIFLTCLVIVAFVAVLGYFARDTIFYQLIALQYEPEKEFSLADSPTTADYNDQSSWVLYKDRDSLAKPAAVLFLHPTTYLSRESWNARTSAADFNETVEDMVVPGQAFAFSECCDLFVPRYRQATFWSYFDRSDSGRQARDLAYSDVARAFDLFLETIGDRPFILSGHSQGAEHVVTLLTERVSGDPGLVNRLVAAYAVGTPIDLHEQSRKTPDIPICEGASAVGCYLSWNSMGPNAETWEDQSGSACVNPLTWSTAGEFVPAQENPGSLSVANGRRMEAHVAGAQCIDDRLLIPKLESDLFSNQPVNLGPENYHLLDYALFFKSIEENASVRVDAMLRNQRF